MGLKRKHLYHLGIVLPGFATGLFLGQQNYYAAFWAAMTGLSQYGQLQKQVRIDRLSTISANFEDFMSKAEVEEIKEFFKTLDSSEEWEKQ